jgi:ornithine cyclodeaminase/alanine dehydrogenase-like protein (mu-crystallin family)
MKTLVLAGKDLEKILTMEIAIPAVEKAFAAHGRGEAVMPPKLYLPLEKYGGDFRAMPSPWATRWAEVGEHASGEPEAVQPARGHGGLS